MNSIENWALTYAFLASLLCVVSVALAIGQSRLVMRRLIQRNDSRKESAVKHSSESRESCRGIDDVLAAMRAHLRSGGTFLDAVEQQSGHSLVAVRLTQSRLSAMLQGHRIRAETDEQIEQVAAALLAVATVSDSLGCEVVRCLDVVSDDYRRLRMVEDLKNNAFAMPEATVRLLSALPLVTVLVGELLGASPVAFLLGTDTGLLCLAVGLLFYAAGLRWLRSLLNSAHTVRTETP